MIATKGVGNHNHKVHLVLQSNVHTQMRAVRLIDLFRVSGDANGSGITVYVVTASTFNMMTQITEAASPWRPISSTEGLRPVVPLGVRRPETRIRTSTTMGWPWATSKVGGDPPYVE